VHELAYANDPERHHARGGVVEAVAKAKQQGKVRFVGFTGHKSPEIHLDMLSRGFAWDTVQMPRFEKQLIPPVADVAVIGSGYWGKNLVRNFAELGALRVVCDSDTKTLHTLGAQYPQCQMRTSFADVLRDQSIQAVAIATPAETHENLVREALLSGKDVFVEKPLCLSAEKGQALVTLAKQQGRILMVGHLLWYHPAILKLKQMIDAGELRVLVGAAFPLAAGVRAYRHKPLRGKVVLAIRSEG